MKFLLLLLLVSSPVFACKMTPLSYESRSIQKALELLGAEGMSGGKVQKMVSLNGHWNIDLLQDKKCTTYAVKVTMPGANCSMNAELLSQKVCSK